MAYMAADFLDCVSFVKADELAAAVLVVRHSLLIIRIIEVVYMVLFSFFAPLAPISNRQL